MVVGFMGAAQRRPSDDNTVIIASITAAVRDFSASAKRLLSRIASNGTQRICSFGLDAPLPPRPAPLSADLLF